MPQEQSLAILQLLVRKQTEAWEYGRPAVVSGLDGKDIDLQLLKVTVSRTGKRSKTPAERLTASPGRASCTYIGPNSGFIVLRSKVLKSSTFVTGVIWPLLASRQSRVTSLPLTIFATGSSELSQAAWVCLRCKLRDWLSAHADTFFG